jgi:hypothetical protein
MDCWALDVILWKKKMKTFQTIAVIVFPEAHSAPSSIIQD